ncbi:MAG: DUF4159 domain-containing protein [Alphaproteobacteria bacterium]|nr:DUF4159 domain-containing protein [Alphaproteobacteria bacterium]
MLTLGSFAFASPWILLALASLPVIWWLLRVTPPAPRRVPFPAVRLLMGLKPTEESSHRTPWWLLLLRLVTAALIIVALAHPLLNPGARLIGSGPLFIAIDDDWAAATRWESRQATLRDLLEQAQRDQRPVALLMTAPSTDGRAIRATDLMPANSAREIIEGLSPKPWPADHEAARQAIDALSFPPPAEVIWLANGLAEQVAESAASRFAIRLSRLGPLLVLADPPAERALVLRPPESGGALRASVDRASSGSRTVWLRGTGDNGQVVARKQVTFASDAKRATVDLDLPTEVRNRLVRLDIEGERSAAATVLIDERWRRRPVGLVSGGTTETAQPLLSDLYYLGRALEPYSEVRDGTIANLTAGEIAVLVLADVGQIGAADRPRLESWVERGGVLVRFAGPRLAENADDLLPVRLRSGARALSGALTWAKPAKLGEFPEASPFVGLPIPSDVSVTRQVLAEPDLNLAAKTWARLTDGTPLITAERRGSGWLVLFHITANTTWSDLSLSGLFVEMLRRTLTLSQGVAGADGNAALPPVSVLDGFGRLVPPSPAVRPMTATEFAEARVGPSHPPGYYGNEDARRALNLSAGLPGMQVLGELPDDVRQAGYSEGSEVNLLPWALLAALLLILLDIIGSLALRGVLWTRPLKAIATILAAAVIAAAWSSAELRAQGRDKDEFAINASLDVRLAYVVTGNPTLDEISRSGLKGLTDILNMRTAVEPQASIGVDVEHDELAFFALIYWPIDPGQKDLSRAAQQKVDAFMKNGGTIIFDTRDQNEVETNPNVVSRGTAEGRGARRLRALLRGLDLPPLVPVPDDHILTKAFYLLREFPGRYVGGTVWVERHSGGSNDGVSSIIIGSHDWASAWATDDNGRPMSQPVPGGAQQREMAYRFGVNLVMYALTGNYKADQVHVPAILERLGQ